MIHIIPIYGIPRIIWILCHDKDYLSSEDPSHRAWAKAAVGVASWGLYFVWLFVKWLFKLWLLAFNNCIENYSLWSSKFKLIPLTCGILCNFVGKCMGLC